MKGFGRSTPIGDDVLLPTIKENLSQIAMSEDGDFLAITVDTSLFVWEYKPSNEQWELTIFSNLLSPNVPNHTISAGVSLSSDGNIVASAIMTSMQDGNYLFLSLFNLTSDSRDHHPLAELKTLLDEPNLLLDTHVVNVDLSTDGEVVAVCAKNHVFVLTRAINDGFDEDIDFEPDMESDFFLDVKNYTIETCGLSGDGQVLAISTSHNGTFVYSYRDPAWELDDTLPTSGSSLSVDRTGKFVAVGGYVDNGITLWEQLGNSSTYRKAYQTRRRVWPNGKSTSSVVLTRGLNSESGQFMAVGFPSDGGRVDVFQIQTV
jgi:WD40 repeat protein